MIGTRLSHYDVIQKLGEGGMATVYKARDITLERIVALKVLPPSVTANPERKLRFVQEARTASSLNHPNIVHIYEIGCSDAVDFIAMEYVQGNSLDQSIGRKGLPWTEVLKYAVQIADALTAAHTAGVIHRDLKPGNLMITEQGLIKVLDFGLAKLTEPLDSEELDAAATIGPKPRTEEGTILGTIAYMSPEQAEGKKVDARSDIFSFGSVLYEMVTGRRAFQGDTKISVLSAILNHEPAPISQVVDGVPHELVRTITRCLRKDSERRFQLMKDVKIALEELKEEAGSSRWPTALQPARRRGVRAAVTAGLVVFAVATGLTWTLRFCVFVYRVESAINIGL
jgi:serine/threonine protein kinase